MRPFLWLLLIRDSPVWSWSGGQKNKAGGRGPSGTVLSPTWRDLIGIYVRDREVSTRSWFWAPKGCAGRHRCSPSLSHTIPQYYCPYAGYSCTMCHGCHLLKPHFLIFYVERDDGKKRRCFALIRKTLIPLCSKGLEFLFKTNDHRFPSDVAVFNTCTISYHLTVSNRLFTLLFSFTCDRC